MLKIYTDGSAQANHSGWGYVVYEDGQLIDAQGELITGATSNQMELTAIIYALKKYGTEEMWGAPTIYTDSIYALNSITKWCRQWQINGWVTSTGTPVENANFIQLAIDLLAHGHYAAIEKVPGHSGVEGNELADQIATGKVSPQSVVENWNKDKNKLTIN